MPNHLVQTYVFQYCSDTCWNNETLHTKEFKGKNFKEIDKQVHLYLQELKSNFTQARVFMEVGNSLNIIREPSGKIATYFPPAN